MAVNLQPHEPWISPSLWANLLHILFLCEAYSTSAHSEMAVNLLRSAAGYLLAQYRSRPAKFLDNKPIRHNIIALRLCCGTNKAATVNPGYLLPDSMYMSGSGLPYRGANVDGSKSESFCTCSVCVSCAVFRAWLTFLYWPAGLHVAVWASSMRNIQIEKPTPPVSIQQSLSLDDKGTDWKQHALSDLCAALVLLSQTQGCTVETHSEQRTSNSNAT
jgi:hypothetical protein